MLDVIKQDKRYLDYLIHFNIKRDYFYCHDLLEEIWLETNREYDVLKYLIQLAIMQYKKQTHNEIGFKKFLFNSQNRFRYVQHDLEKLGIDSSDIAKKLQRVHSNQDKLYEFQIQLIDEDLKNQLLNCKNQTHSL